MKTPRSTALAERLIVWTAIIVLTWFLGYEWGRHTERQAPKVCAKVMGMTPVHSTATECTYIMGTQGRAYWKYLAVKEGRK
jgi:hypothetical protein